MFGKEKYGLEENKDNTVFGSDTNDNSTLSMIIFAILLFSLLLGYFGGF